MSSLVDKNNFVHATANSPRLFACLLCWTTDRLSQSGLFHPIACLLCGQAKETIQRILISLFSLACLGLDFAGASTFGPLHLVLTQNVSAADGVLSSRLLGSYGSIAMIVCSLFSGGQDGD